MTMPLRPGRYEVRGGPRGEYAICRLTTERRTARRDNYTDRWPILAKVNIPQGAAVTRPGLLNAVARCWSYGR